jgi:uncharacterized protein
VNVWIALSYSGHVHHQTASEWFRGLPPDSRLCFCRFTQIGMLRLLTTEAVMADEVMSQKEAWNAHDRWMADERILFLEEPSTLEESFRAFSSESHPRPKDWAHTYIAAFAAVCGLKVVTFDRGFRRRLSEMVLLSQ